MKGFGSKSRARVRTYHLTILLVMLAWSHLTFAQVDCSETNSVATSRWHLIGLSCNVLGSDTVEDVFGDDFDPLDYGQKWVLYSHDAVSDSFHPLALTSSLVQGEGYWIYTTLQDTYDVEGSFPSIVSKINSPECPSADGCYEIALDSPDNTELNQFNLVSHPFISDTQWADVCIYDGTTSYTPSQADALSLMSKNIFKYNGNTHETFDDVTMGLLGVLQVHDGFWVNLLEESVGENLTLLIPAGPVSDPCGNLPPVLDEIFDQTIEFGSNFSLQSSATDPDPGDILSYSLDLAPLGMTINGSSLAGFIEWLAAEDQIGPHQVTVRATDPGGLFDQESFQLTVLADDNNPPELIAPGNRTIQASMPFATPLFAIDEDVGDTLTFSLLSAPVDMTVDPQSGLLEWQPDQSDLGMNMVTAMVQDDGGLVDTKQFSVEVVEPIEPPAENAAPELTVPEDLLVTVGDAIAVQASATDSDAGDVLTFSFIRSPGGMTINSATGAISWLTGPAFIGNHDVTVKVTDTLGAIDADNFVVTVKENNNPPTAIDDIYSVNYGELLSVPVAGVLNNDEDPNSDPLTAILVSQPTKGSVSLNSDGSFLYQANTAGLVVQQDINLTLKALPAINVSSEFSSSFSRSRAVDNDLQTSWFTERPDPLAPNGFIELDFLSDVTVKEVHLFGNREFSGGFDFLSGKIELIDGLGNVLYDSGDLDLPDNGGTEPNRDLVHLVDPPVSNVHKVRFTSSAIQNSNGEAGLSEFHVIGDGRAKVFDAEQQWSWEGGVDEHGVTINGATETVPAVIDLNGDQIPEVIFNVTSGHLLALNGTDGTPLFIVGGSGDPDRRVAQFAAPAVGDIDNDGLPEIIIPGSTTSFIKAYESDGSLKWISDQLPYSVSLGSTSLADLNGDGVPEIIPSSGSDDRGVTVLNADGSIRFQTEVLGSGNNSYVAGNAIVSDIDLDGSPDIIAGNTVYNADGSTKWHRDDLSDGYNAVANLDEDAFAEVVLVSSGNIYVLEHSGITKHTSALGSSRGGAPTIADFDLDGKPEIGVASTNKYNVYEDDLSPKWDAPIDDGSGRTGSTVFDFENDGVAEVVFSDQERLYVFRGTDGKVLLDIEARSTTGVEAPIVADVDNDGSAEIVAQASSTGDDQIPALFVLKAADNNWAPARPIWNQNSYHVTNINLDGSIPKYEQPNWLTPGLNNFRQNQFLPEERPDAVDSFTYNANDGALDSNLATVSIELLPANTAPEFISGPNEIATVGFTYLYGANAVDVENDGIIFSLSQGPAGMTIDAPTGLVRWIPVAADLGEQQVTLIATDSLGFSNFQHYVVSVIEPVAIPDVVGLLQAQAEIDLVAADLVTGRLEQINHKDIPAGTVISQFPPAGTAAEVGSRVDLLLSLGPAPEDIDDDGDGVTENEGDCNDGDDTIFPGAVDNNGDGIDQDCDGIDGNQILEEIIIEPGDIILLVGQQIELSAIGVFDDGTSQNLTGLVTWSNGGNIFNAVSAGNFDITATRGAVSAMVTIRVEDPVFDNAPPIVEITSPVPLVTITAPTDLIGTVSDDNLLKYTIEIAPVGDQNFTEIATGTNPIIDGLLGEFDPTLLLNDLYTVRLTAYDLGGNVSAAEVVYQVDENMKVGNFTLSFIDLQIPMSGIPITVNRTYDSRDKRLGDFGIGWRLDVQTLSCRANRVLGTGWEVVNAGLSFQLLANDEHKVSITLPGGRVEEFDMVVSPTVSPFLPFPPFANRASFRARPGTLGELRSLDNNNLTILDPQPGGITLLDDITNQIYNPQRFRYTQADGTEIIISKESGVEKITEPNGNALEFRNDGIFHSGGKQALFERDGLGRISKITDPNGNIQHYSYDANGDLVVHSDSISNETRFLYNRNHGLLEIVDPSGSMPIRNEYDNNGRLIASVDANGNRVEYTHDLSARQSITENLNGGITVSDYDENGLIVAQTDPLGGVTRYSYDSNGYKTSVTDPVGRVFNFTYDSVGNLLSRSDPLGNTEVFTYNVLGNQTSSTDALGNTSSITYDASGVNPLSETDAAGNTTSYTYDSKGNRSTINSPEGDFSVREYDASGNVIREVDYLGFEVTYEYDQNSNRISETERLEEEGGAVLVETRFEYDSSDNQVRTIFPDGTSHSVEYDFSGKKTVFTDQNGNATRYEYDVSGNLTKEIFADGSSRESSYDANGNKLQQLDENGNATQFIYDLNDRIVSTTYPDGGVLTNVYNGNGEIVKNIDALGNQTSFEFDDAGRIVKLTDAAGNQTLRTYDANGNLVAEEDANGNTTSFTYDPLDRLVRTTFADSTSTQVEYGSRANVVREIDQAGLSTIYEYDALNRLVATTDAQGDIVRYTYDVRDNLISQDEANGQVTRWEYNHQGQLVRKIYPLGTTESYLYDPNGNVVSTVDANGNATVFIYDVKNQLERKSFADGTSEVTTYTPTGMRASVTSEWGETNYQYDSKDRLLTVLTPDNNTVSYTYDSMDNRTSVSVNSRTDITQYDALNRPISILDSRGGITNYSYDAAGNRSALQYPNGVTTGYTYDALNRLVSMESKRSDMSLISRYSYALGAAGNRTKLTEHTGREVDYTYDNVYRLVEEKISDPVEADRTITYSYDAQGNRLSKVDNGSGSTLFYDANNRLISDETYQYTYDPNGNLISKTSSAENISYSYDFENRMTFTSSGDTTYQYNADGLLVSENRSGVISNYVIDINRQHAQILEEQDGNAATLVEYTYGDDLISQTRDTNTSYYVYDGQLSTRSLLDESEVETDQYTYDAFGVELSRQGATLNNYLFSGERYDPNSGFYYLRARSYDPSLGRFTTADAFPADRFDPATLHRYVYVKNNPVNLTDPSGEFFTLIDLSVSLSISSGTQKDYVKMLGKAFLSTVKIAKCGIEPGAAMRNRGLELITDPRLGHMGARLLVTGNEMIAAAYGELNIALAKNAKEFTDKFGPKIKANLKLSFEVGKALFQASRVRNFANDSKKKLDKAINTLLKVEDFLNAVEAKDPCKVIKFIADEAGAA